MATGRTIGRNTFQHCTLLTWYASGSKPWVISCVHCTISFRAIECSLEPDQDLPNYAQHMVPIYSLPQDWLWCESWCSDETKATSKTIDLCNNPKHKEPKLDMAKRVIAGPLFKESWVELDDMVQAAERRIFNIGQRNETGAARTGRIVEYCVPGTHANMYLKYTCITYMQNMCPLWAIETPTDKLANIYM